MDDEIFVRKLVSRNRSFPSRQSPNIIDLSAHRLVLTVICPRSTEEFSSIMSSATQTQDAYRCVDLDFVPSPWPPPPLPCPLTLVTPALPWQQAHHRRSHSKHSRRLWRRGSRRYVATSRGRLSTCDPRPLVLHRFRFFSLCLSLPPALPRCPPPTIASDRGRTFSVATKVGTKSRGHRCFAAAASG